MKFAMHPRIAKDIRLIRPAWLLTGTLLIATAFLPHGQGSEWVILIVIFGLPVVAASMFGGEFNDGTLPQLLAQPVDRRRVWYEKMLVLTIALGSLLLVVLTSGQASWLIAMVAICAFCTVPFFTFVGRSTISGVILAIPLPAIVYIIGAISVLWLFGRGTLETEENQRQFDLWVRAYSGILFPAYCALLYYLGYRRFRSLEVTDAAPRQFRLPAWMHRVFEQVLACFFSRQRALRVLIGKELHFQHNALIMFLIFVLVQTAMVAYIKFAHPKDPETSFIVPLFIYIGLMPLVIGSSAIAEEQSVGTRAWHLTLPCSVRMQWLVKATTVLLFTAIFGLGIPLVWLAIGKAFVVPTLGWPDHGAVLLYCSTVFLLAFLSFYASSFSRDTLRALLSAVGLSAALPFILMWLGSVVEHSPLKSGLLRPFVQHFGTAPVAAVLTSAWLIVGLPALCLFILLLLNSFKHFTTLDHSPVRVWSNMLLVFLAPVALFFLLLNLAVAIRVG